MPNIKHLALSCSLAFAALAALPAHAGVYSDDLGKCMVSSSSAQQKQQLVQWIFFAISLNPSIKPYANITPAQRDAANKDIAGLFEKLLGDTCNKEAREAIKYEGVAAFGESFRLFGQVAGQEIFASPEVSAGAAEYTKHLDVEGLQKKLGLPAGK
jgi:hypothetical protein